MRKIKLLLDVVEDMRSLADSLAAVADAMPGNEAPAEVAEKPVEKPAPALESVREISLEEVRAVLARKSQSGFTADVRDIIRRYGASKLSEIEPKHYADILKDAEVLANG